MALAQEFGVTAAIVTGEVCPRYPSSTTTPMTTANLGEVITDAAAWWQQRLRRAGLTQTNIDAIDATNEPGLFRRCREVVKKKAAIAACRRGGQLTGYWADDDALVIIANV